MSNQNQIPVATLLRVIMTKETVYNDQQGRVMFIVLIIVSTVVSKKSKNEGRNLKMAIERRGEGYLLGVIE